MGRAQWYDMAHNGRPMSQAQRLMNQMQSKPGWNGEEGQGCSRGPCLDTAGDWGQVLIEARFFLGLELAASRLVAGSSFSAMSGSVVSWLKTTAPRGVGDDPG